MFSFIQTNQTSIIETDITPDSSQLPAIVSGMREVCVLASTLLGGVASANSQVASSTSNAPVTTATSSAVRTNPIPIRCLLTNLGVAIMGGLIANV